MFTLKGFHLSEKKYEDSKSVMYGGIRESDAEPVMVKHLKAEYPTPEELNLFEFEYRITKALDLPGVVRVYSLENVGHSRAMVMEGFEAVPLDEYLSSHKGDLPEFLQVAGSLADIIGDVHKHNIIHRGIWPHNILINPQTKQVKITDFGDAAMVKGESEPPLSQEMIRVSLFYISPEQAGIMNRSVDYRTDFYSLGVTLYEMLTGRLPFVSDDPMEVVHAHIAKVPARPDEVKEGIPEVVSEIVMKLLSKAAEERYQRRVCGNQPH